LPGIAIVAVPKSPIEGVPYLALLTTKSCLIPLWETHAAQEVLQARGGGIHGDSLLRCDLAPETCHLPLRRFPIQRVDPGHARIANEHRGIVGGQANPVECIPEEFPALLGADDLFPLVVADSKAEYARPFTS
jgi:hypothetical protein